MEGKRNNIQNTLAKESLFTALVILLGEKDFEDISITELAGKAGVSRMAFYRNYTSKEDIITQYIDERFAEYQNLLLSKDATTFEVAHIFFAYVKSQEKLFTNVVRAKMEHLLFDRYDVHLVQLFKTLYQTQFSDNDAYYLDFLSGGLYKVIMAWVRNGFKESEGEMAAMLSALAPKIGAIRRHRFERARHKRTTSSL